MLRIKQGKQRISLDGIVKEGKIEGVEEGIPVIKGDKEIIYRMHYESRVSRVKHKGLFFLREQIIKWRRIEYGKDWTDA